MRFEPSIHLVDVTEHGALIVWGGFWLDHREGRVWVVDDDELPPGGTIGSCSPSYGHAQVEIHRGDCVVARAETSDVNHAWLEGLEPDTGYTYQITVDDKPWCRKPDASARTRPRMRRCR